MIQTVGITTPFFGDFLGFPEPKKKHPTVVFLTFICSHTVFPNNFQIYFYLFTENMDFSHILFPKSHVFYVKNPIVFLGEKSQKSHDEFLP